jgi:hypothetical protein
MRPINSFQRTHDGITRFSSRRDWVDNIDEVPVEALELGASTMRMIALSRNERPSDREERQTSGGQRCATVRATGNMASVFHCTDANGALGRTLLDNACYAV